jgi:homoserine kinase
MTDYNGIKVFAPATVSNLGSGFDIIGFPIEEAGDTVTIRKSETPGLRIANITGYTGVPWLPEKNTASFAVMKMMEGRDLAHGFEMEIHKGVKPGSGVGSSASSSAAAVVAANEWFGRPLNTLQLIELAMESEALASGSRHADNVAPAIMGGIAVVRSYNPLDVIRIEPPQELWVALLHPQIEIRTETSRKILPHSVPLKDAICQWGNVAGLIAGFYSSDYDLIGRSMQDVIVEPVRAELIPGYQQLKAAALQAGALNCSISGSGPSVSAICKGAGQAKRVSQAMEAAYQPMEISYETYVSRVNNQGAAVVETW